MNVEITLPDGIVGEVLSDVSSSRGGHILGIKSLGARFSDEGGTYDSESQRSCLSALIPLSEMVGYTRYLRAVSKGEATFTMNFSHYERLSGQKQSEVLNNPFFF